jgi:hypothetical protein
VNWLSFIILFVFISFGFAHGSIEDFRINQEGFLNWIELDPNGEIPQHARTSFESGQMHFLGFQKIEEMWKINQQANVKFGFLTSLDLTFYVRHLSDEILRKNARTVRSIGDLLSMELAKGEASALEGNNLNQSAAYDRLRSAAANLERALNVVGPAPPWGECRSKLIRWTPTIRF